MEKKRSDGITLFGIIEIGYGGFLLLGGLAGFNSDPSALIAVIIAVIMFWLGIGMLKLKPYARKINIWFIFLQFLFSILVSVLGAFHLTNGSWFQIATFIAGSTIIGALLFGALIYFLRHPKVKEQFK